MNAGETLLLCNSAIEAAVRFQAFVEDSGLPPEAVLSSTMSAMPLPIYSDFGVSDASGRPLPRWKGTRAEFMWHPVMWLPPRVAGRYTLIDSETGEQVLEDDDLWTVRMALELTASGLYNPADGTWFDVLAAHGIDVTDELDLARVQDWLDGYPDELLDEISLSEYMDIDPPSWAMESALAIRDQLKRASWALLSDDLLSFSDDVLSHSGSLSHRDQLIALRSLASLSESLLASAPTHSDTGEPLSPDGTPHAEFFARMHDAVDLDTEQPDALNLIDFLNQARERLHRIREANWAHLEELTEGEERPEPAGV